MCDGLIIGSVDARLQQEEDTQPEEAVDKHRRPDPEYGIGGKVLMRTPTLSNDNRG